MSGNNVTLQNPSFYCPEIVVIEILSRIPVKSIIRFMAVCKTWQALLENPILIFKHMKQNKSVSLVHFYKYPEDNTMSLYFDNAKPINLNFPFLHEARRVTIVGVSNGLYCVSYFLKEFNFTNFNPSTRRFNKIPYSNLWQDAHVQEAAPGFGFSSKSGDYKVVNLMRYYDKNSNLSEKAGIYTIGTKSWRIIDIQAPIDNVKLEDFSSPTVIKGVLYWECLKWKFILSFDIYDEAFGKIAVPIVVNNGSYSKFTQVNEELAIFRFGRERSFTLWTMNQRSMVWDMKLAVVLPMVAEPKAKDVHDVGDIKMVGCEKDGILVFEDRTSINIRLFSFNITTRQIKKLPFGQPYCEYRVFSHTESLVPVNNIYPLPKSV